jgi:DNA polymerase III subunit gamma/tau
LRDAESYFDQVVSFCGNKVDNDTVIKCLILLMMKFIFHSQMQFLKRILRKGFEISNTIYNNGWSYIDFLDGLTEHFRNIMTVVITGRTDLIETAEVYRGRYYTYQEKFSEGDIIRLLNFLNKTQQELRFSQNQKLKVEISLTQMIALEKTDTLSRILSGLESNSTTPTGSSSAEKPGQSGFSSAPIQKPKPAAEAVHPPKEKKVIIPPADPVNTDISSPHTEFNTDTIIRKWGGFVQSISEEKMLLGRSFSTVQVIGYENNRIKITAADEDTGMISLWEDYLHKKAHQYFGKKVKLECVVSAGKTAPAAPAVKEAENDPYISAIMKELGGERIS